MANREDRSVAALFSDLTQELTQLLRQEIELAKVEISDKVSELQTGIASLAIGGGVAFGGFLVLLVALVLGLDQWIQQLWLSALIVGLVVTSIGVALVRTGRSELSPEKLVPQQSPESLWHDTDLAKAI